MGDTKDVGWRVNATDSIAETVGEAIAANLTATRTAPVDRG
jgi:hypothetical protein